MRERLRGSASGWGQRFLFVFAVAALFAPWPCLSQDDLSWGISELSGVDANLPTDDLAGLYRAIGKAQFVGLGESIHTSGGFYRTKERVIRALIEEQGFRAFALETPWSRAEIFNDYVQTCSGSPETAVTTSMFLVWAGEAMRDLAQWMCDWNRRNPKQRVIAYGFDVQQPSQDFEALRTFLDTTGLQTPAEFQQVNQCYLSSERIVAQGRIDTCLGALAALRDFFDANEPALIAATSAAALAEARIRELGLRAWQQQISLPSPRSSEARDAAMAEVFEFQRKRLAPKARTVVWAHNAHLTRHPRGTFFRSLGHWLNLRHGDDYKPVALFAGEVFIDWRGVGCSGPFYSHGADDLEEVLGAQGTDLFVDFSRLSNDHPVLKGCTPYAFANRTPEVLLDHFEGAIFLEVSPPMDYIDPTRSCGAKPSTASTSSAPAEFADRQPSNGCNRPRITSLAAASSSSDSITLTWESAGVTDGHRLERWRNGRLEITIDLPADAESYADSGLALGDSYRYVLTGTNRYGAADAVATSAETEPPNLAPCVSDMETLCLGDGRFEVSAEWRTAGEDGVARVAPPGTDDSGVLWFFAEDNWEMLVKVLDGCAVNGHYWVLSTATTDVGYDLQIRDTTSGAVGRYVNDLGSSAEAIIDTQAFSNCSSSAAKVDPQTRRTSRSATPSEAKLDRALGEAICTPSPEVLCLQDGRIQVEVGWDDGRGNSGRGFVAPVIDRSSGLFWFFDSLNWEILIKVLDGCAINGHRWVFFGGTTDVGLTVTVTDLETGEQKTYGNVAGTPADTVTDTRALSCS